MIRMNKLAALTVGLIVAALCGSLLRATGEEAAGRSLGPAGSSTAAVPSTGIPSAETDLPTAPLDDIQSWDYAPYRVEVWLAASPAVDTAYPQLAQQLQQSLEQSFGATWRVRVRPAPVHAQTMIARDLSRLTYDRLAAADMVLAIPAGGAGNETIRSAGGAVDKFAQILTTEHWADDVRRRAMTSTEASGVPALVKALNVEAATSASVLQSQWAAGDKAIVVPKELADSLVPAPRTIILPIADQLATFHQSLDKVYFASVERLNDGQIQVVARELDVMLRYIGQPSTRIGTGAADRIASLAISDAFAPLVRLEEAERKTARGRLRAGGLTVSPDELAAARPGEVWQAFLRRDDRLGNPDLLQPLDWTLLQATGVNGALVDFDVYAGRSGGVQGRRNKRTQRLALRLRPQRSETVLRLHARNDPQTPLVGYTIYEKVPPQDGEMQLVGQTAWDGTLSIERTDQPLRLFYVKNGAAILARLPLMPGVQAIEQAGLQSDDARLRAEAYVRGIENAIVDQVAVRQLLAARIRRRLEQKKFDEAQTLLEELRALPTYDTLSEQMRRMSTEINSSDTAQQARITKMFADTRQLLVRFITPKLIDDLELEISSARSGKPIDPVSSKPPEERIPIETTPAGDNAPAIPATGAERGGNAPESKEPSVDRRPQPPRPAGPTNAPPTASEARLDGRPEDQ